MVSTSSRMFISILLPDTTPPAGLELLAISVDIFAKFAKAGIQIGSGYRCAEKLLIKRSDHLSAQVNIVFQFDCEMVLLLIGNKPFFVLGLSRSGECDCHLRSL